ncbi:MAG TPA: gamma-glutamyl-phosphate reductase, partial [Chromatiales bacterium]|nr:gamma-glutamyl-phosphate reductase [Chromatiales bacterium]
MNVASQESGGDIVGMMQELGRSARAASTELARAGTAARNAALRAIRTAIRDSEPDILAANALDMQAATTKGLSSAMLDRLLLSPERVQGMADSIGNIEMLPDPIGDVIAEWS